MLAAFSDGASRTGSTEPWIPTQYERLPRGSAAGTGFWIECVPSADQAHIRFGVNIPVSSTGYQLGIERNVAIRVLCHLLVDQLPDGSLQELCETLADMRTFYTCQIEQPRLMAQHGLYDATVSGVRERPEFEFGD